MFKTMRPFDGRSLYLKYGAISRICTWKPEAGSLSMIQVTYGQHVATANGELPKDVPMVPHCVSFGPKERIVEVQVWSGLLVDGMRFTTTDRRRSSIQLALMVNSDLTEAPTRVLKAPPGGYLAAISGYIGKYNYYIPGGATYTMVTSLQYDWAINN